LTGPDYLRLGALCDDIAGRLSRNPRIRDIETNATGWSGEDAVTLTLTPDRRRLARMGLSMADLVSDIQPAVANDLATRKIATDAGDINGRIRLGDGDALSPHELLALFAQTPGAVPYPMDAVLRLEERPVQREIRRREQQYERNVAFEFRGPRKVGNRFVKSLLENTALPPGYSIEDGFGVFLTRKQEQDIYLALFMALLLIYIVAAALFESLLLPFVALLSVPLSFIGIVALFWALGETFDRTAYIGLILLAGIAINNSLLLVHRAGALLRLSGDRRHAALRAAAERIRPILMTTITSIAGLLPLAAGGGAAAGNWRTLALSATGGLIASTIFTLFLIPVLFTLFSRKGKGPVQKRQLSLRRRQDPLPA
jgi:HAE1 family hydrophobic/amphiphilic exporter-1